MSENYVANDFDSIAKSLAGIKQAKQTELAKDPDKAVEIVANTNTSHDDTLTSMDGWCF